MRELSLGRSHTAVKAAVSAWQAVAAMRPQLPVNVRDVEVVLRASAADSMITQQAPAARKAGSGAMQTLKSLLLPLAIRAVLLTMLPVAVRVKSLHVLLRASPWSVSCNEP